ncbi:MAG: hypothetical protein CVV47_07525 [Spirochaetae bacterium HGW-Spirochaetae-3]|jgi:hypothetical protein|nr:MAG: hypothetical protein CVV47_07525 [Spirochaetae bacterium HGW-Spirochaetae-3]
MPSNGEGSASARELVRAAFARKALPDGAWLAALVGRARETLGRESESLRPAALDGRPGGLLRLPRGIATIVVPDLHARGGFVLSLLETSLPEGGAVIDALAAGKLQILCLGDGFHAEARAAERWKRAYGEFLGGYREKQAMDEEMGESLSLMEMIMICKIAYPDRFHFLKGNHENVLDEEGDGNHSFGKFAEEGAMVAEYMTRFYGPELTAAYAAFEKDLPLFAAGGRFLASHAEPARAFSDEELTDAPNRPDVILGLTWTDNGAADPGAVPGLLDRFLPDDPDARYFTGHRPVPMRKRYRERSGGRHLQIHAPDSYNVAWVMPDRPFDKDLDIGAIRDLSSSFKF